jgi:hypothetical protein
LVPSGKPCRVGQLGLDRFVFFQLRARAFLADVEQAGPVLPAAAVEQGQRLARLHAHHVQVVGDGFRQVDDGAGGKRLGAVKTWHG